MGGISLTQTGKPPPREVRKHVRLTLTRLRFDFLFYQFSFSSSYTQFFFLPESVLPNSFYSDQEREVSFERDEFRPFRVHLDNTGRWIDRILEIIRQHPSPRQTAARPIRSTAEDPIKQPELTVQPAKQTQPASAQTKKRKEYSQLVQEKHRIFYRRIMDECCRRSVKIPRPRLTEWLMMTVQPSRASGRSGKRPSTGRFRHV